MVDTGVDRVDVVAVAVGVELVVAVDVVLLLHSPLGRVRCNHRYIRHHWPVYWNYRHGSMCVCHLRYQKKTQKKR